MFFISVCCLGQAAPSAQVLKITDLHFGASSLGEAKDRGELGSKSIKDVGVIHNLNSKAYTGFIFQIQGCGHKVRVVLAIKGA